MLWKGERGIKDLRKQFEEKTKDKIYDLLKGNYACSRSWEAWQYGTMHQEDFSPLEEEEELIEEFYTLVLHAVGQQHQELREKIKKLDPSTHYSEWTDDYSNGFDDAITDVLKLLT